MAFKGIEYMRAKIITDTKGPEYITEFTYLGCSVSYKNRNTTSYTGLNIQGIHKIMVRF
jgi:hypothetical protein